MDPWPSQMATAQRAVAPHRLAAPAPSRPDPGPWKRLSLPGGDAGRLSWVSGEVLPFSAPLRPVRSAYGFRGG
jgi:hypothetical protein